MIVISVLLCFIFLVLSILHFAWAAGSIWGYEAVLPTQSNGERLFTPTPISCAVVGLGLMAFAFFYLQKSGYINLNLPNIFESVIGWIIPSIFTLRAIGEFKYVGFFKKIRNTRFAKMDNQYFSPLCIILGVLGYMIQMNA